ncbi:MAG: hypothetical protein Q7R22_003100 [Verrucomicrobiota bacterium JB025]|nr:hypothetical protein [Verrucomicrobiota bacterium JB025]
MIEARGFARISSEVMGRKSDGKSDGKERRNVFADADEEAAARLEKMVDLRLEI